MVITYYGLEYFKLTLGDLTIALNPPSKDSKSLPKAPRFGADIVLSSLNQPDYNGVETVAFGEKTPFVIDSAGNYEVQGMFFAGAGGPVTIDDREYFNTVYGFDLDGIKLAFLGVVEDEKILSSAAKEIADAADLLFVSIGGNPSVAYKMATSFSPSIIIPMNYSDQSLTRFLKEAGQEKVHAEEKLTLKRRDLEGKEAHIVVLSAEG